MHSMNPRLALLAAVMLVAAALFAQSASAMPPTSVHYTVSGPVTVEGICSFPFVLDGSQDYTVKTFYDQDGNVTQRLTSGTEQDTFSANGQTLVGDPYHFNFNSQYENGVRVSYTGAAVVEKVHLPDGSLFIIAGRVAVTGALVFSVDSGNSGDIEAFCAALS